MQNLLTHKIPSEMVHGFFIDGNELYANIAYKNDIAALSYLSLVKKVNKHINISWLPLEELTDIRQQAISSQGSNTAVSIVKNSDVEEYAIELFKSAKAKKSSDIHILYEINKARIMFREGNGDVVVQRQLDPSFCIRLMAVIFQTMSQDQNSSTFTTNNRLEAKINNPEYLPKDVAGVRVHSEPLACKLGSGCKMVLRLLYEIILGDEPLEQILKSSGYSKNSVKDIMEMIMKPGACFLSGPTGSGKSTTLDKIVGKMKKDVFPFKEFLSIEDPPEYPIPEIRQVAINEIDPKKKAEAMMQALAGALRSDPDVLILGEVRTPEAATMAFSSVDTGHGLWTTIHASSSFGVITRLVGLLARDNIYTKDMVCDPRLLSGIIYQRLVPRLCDHCKINMVEHINQTKGNTSKITEKVLSDLKELIPGKLRNVYLSGGGCEHCLRGSSGRIICAETILCDQNFFNFIKDGENTLAIEYWKSKLGGKTYIEHAVEHIANGLCDPLETTISLKANLK